MESLAPEQIRFVCRQIGRWLYLKEQHERNFGRGERRWKDGELTRLTVDVDHSALLYRLLSGKEPLPEPPPLEHAYPKYPD